MRILFLTNFFPPARSGGYTQWCHEVTQCLVQRGHTIGVLTSRYELSKVQADEENVYRLLHLEGDLLYYQPLHFFTQWERQRRENLAFLEQTINQFAPDLLFVWGMWALSKSLAAQAERLMPGRVVYFLSDYWASSIDMHTSYWQLPTQHKLMRAPKRVLSALAMSMLAEESRTELKLERVICVSARVRDLLIEAGLPVQHARIIYGGTDVERFFNHHPRHLQSEHMKLLYAGQLVRHKGVHTAIEAIGKLVNERKIDQISLTLIGAGHPEYEAYLRDLIDREHLHDYVTFLQPVSNDKMPEILQQFDVLIFPSIYEEPFARIVLEAMASGLVVVGTTTGGTQEILRHGVTGLTFMPEDAQALAEHMIQLNTNFDLYQRLSHAGQKTVLEYFTLDRMAQEIETYLIDSLMETSRA